MTDLRDLPFRKLVHFLPLRARSLCSVLQKRFGPTQRLQKLVHALVRLLQLLIILSLQFSQLLLLLLLHQQLLLVRVCVIQLHGSTVRSTSNASTAQARCALYRSVVARDSRIPKPIRLVCCYMILLLLQSQLILLDLLLQLLLPITHPPRSASAGAHTIIATLPHAVPPLASTRFPPLKVSQGHYDLLPSCCCCCY